MKRLMLVLLLMAFAASSFGATAYRKIRFSHPEFQDADIRAAQADTLIDSIVTGYPVIDSLLGDISLPMIVNYDLYTIGGDSIPSYGNFIPPIPTTVVNDTGYLPQRYLDSLEVDSIRYGWWSGTDTFSTFQDTVFDVPFLDSFQLDFGVPNDLALTYYYTSGDTQTFMWWLPAGYTPAGIPTAGSMDYVTAYIRVGEGIFDSATGSMIARGRLELQVNLLGGKTFRTTDWAIIPKQYKKKPDDSGLVRFFLPANTALSPAGSYYELSYKSQNFFSRSYGVIRRFTLDSLPDPQNIMETNEVP